MMKKFNLKSIWAWIRSKYYSGYSQPTPEEIEKFLTENFDRPTFKRGEKIQDFKINDLHAVIDAHFNFSCDKEINKKVWRKLNYTVVTKRQSMKHAQYKCIQLAIKKR